MFNLREYLTLIINIFRCFPHLIVFYTHKNKSIIKEDIKRAYILMERKYIKPPMGLLFLLGIKQFRNLFYLRTKPFSIILNFIYPKLQTLNIQTKNVGEGFAIIHGVATEIGAKSIGKNCTVYQKVTIGGTIHGSPVLLDNIIIYTGAVVIGSITIGNNVVIGANSTVYRDIPDNSLVLPGTSKVMKWKNEKASP